MAVQYNYSSTAGEYTLQMALAPTATSVQLDSVNGLPSAPFKLVLEPGQPTEEIVKVTAVAGTSLTVVRGWDGTNAVNHSAPCKVRHMMTAEDLRLSRQHEDSTSAHGTVGTIVGTTDAQALTNKNLTSATNVFPSSLATLSGTQILTNKDLSSSSNLFPSSLATLSGAQALTNKDLSSSTNTFPASLATLTGAQTLTNKTLSGSSNTFTNIPRSALSGLDWQDFTPRLYNNMSTTPVAISTTIDRARYAYIGPNTVVANVQVSRQAGVTTTGGLGIDLPVPAKYRNLNCGTLIVMGSSAPSGQTGIACMSADGTKLIPVRLDNSYIDVDPNQSIRYSVTYEV